MTRWETETEMPAPLGLLRHSLVVARGRCGVGWQGGGRVVDRLRDAHSPIRVRPLHQRYRRRPGSVGPGSIDDHEIADCRLPKEGRGVVSMQADAAM